MALFHEVARHLSAVLDGFLGEEIRREGLLDSRAACVFLVAEDAPDGLGVPFLLARDRQDMTCSQFFGDPAGCHTFNEMIFNQNLVVLAQKMNATSRKGDGVLIL